MALQNKQIVTVTENYQGLAFKAGQQVRYIGTNNTGHKFQALTKENGSFKKEDWLNEKEWK